MDVEKIRNIDTTFDDIAGMKETKLEVKEFIDYFKNFEKYKKLGAKIPRGSIFFGVSGCGKTLLARALAGESQVPFFSVSGSDFVEVYVGVGAARVRNLFEQARNEEKAIIFIDEIDAIGRPRGLNAQYGGGSDERQNTLNQLLLELDGFSENDNILVFGASNVQKDGLDQALLRPGRFDRELYIDKPDKDDRIEIFEFYLKKMICDDQCFESIERFADLSIGLTGADIETIVNEAGIYAIRRKSEIISSKDVEDAIERIILGIPKEKSIITEEEKKIISYHESAHAIVSYFLENCDPVLKISIMQRGYKVGFTRFMPKESHIKTFDYFKDTITQLISGRVCEKIIFDHVSTGSVDDLKMITELAYSAISLYGFDENLGPISFQIPGTEQMTVQKPYSEDIAEKIDQKVKELIDSCYERSEIILQNNRGLLEKLSNELFDKEIINKERFLSIIKEIQDTK